MSFHVKEVVWAKVKNYPWWPALISKVPDQPDGNYKVLFIAEDNYAVLDPKAVHKYEEHYRDHSKGAKSKKLCSAIQKADEILKNKIETGKKAKKVTASKDVEKRQPSEAMESESQSGEASEMESEKQKDEEVSPSQEHLISLEKDVSETVDRGKIQKLESEMQKIVVEFQGNRIKEWKYGSFFKQFKTDHLTNDELLQSNLTRMLRYLIDRMKECQIDQNVISQAEQLSCELKDRIMSHLTDTHYYDQYLRVVDKNRQNKQQIQSHISKALKKQCSNKVKKQFIQLFVSIIGDSVTNGVPFKDREFLNDLKEKKYDINQLMQSKAATQRFGNQMVVRYQ